MACTTINAKILLRRDDSANWAAANPVLGLGEPGFEVDTDRLKIGDGTTAWNDLPYIGIGDNNLIFTDIGSNTRQLTEYKENDITYTVRSANLSGNMFNIVLASFTPTLSAAGNPSSTLNWDIPSAGFTVTVVNPDDFPSQYISGVASSVAQGGSVFSALGDFTAGAKSAVPAGGVDWTQAFATNGTGVIRSSSTTIAGGNSSAILSFYVTPNGSTIYGTTVLLTITWRTPTLNISAANLSGKTFLDLYNSTTYSLAVTNVTNSGNYVHAVTASGGTVNNATGNGTFTFTTPIHKDNTGVTRTVSTTTTFTRPVDVTGTSYSVPVSDGPSGFTTTFTYPSFWIFKAPSLAPTQPEIVAGNAFNTPSVTVLANQTKVFSALVNNPSANPQIFWFGIRTSASQPTSFQAGASISLLVPVTPTTDSVALYPSSIPSGYVNEAYSLYGITLQPGNTYISIS